MQPDQTLPEKDEEEVKSNKICGGPIKCSVTFFGQALPNEFKDGNDFIRNVPNKEMFKIPKLTDEPDPKPEKLYGDKGGCNLMIIIGTALAVQPFAGTIDAAEIECPKVLINMGNTDNHGYDF